ncbi:MAG TPA: hypothetical protein VII01_02360 [Solirubrobacteraceae bacterium]|jgi:hypothetical protein
MYATDAEVVLADHQNQPGSPRTLRGGGEIGAWVQECDDRQRAEAGAQP